MATALRSKSPKPASRRRDRKSSPRHQSNLHPAQSVSRLMADRGRSPAKPMPPTSLMSGSAAISASRFSSRHGAGSSVRQLPAKRSYPLWLRLLIHLQRGSLIVTFVLVTAALVVYGSTMYMQQLWSKEYRKLKTMQRSERLMLTAEGFLKNQIIQQAEQPGSGLVPKTPEHTIYLQPAPARPAPPVNSAILKSDPSQGGEPLGY